MNTFNESSLSHFRTFGVICPLITCTSFYYGKAPSLKYPPPPLFKGRKLMIPSLLSLPPLPFSFLTNLINQSRLKPLFGLILNDLFTCWNFRFVFDPRLYEYQVLVFGLIPSLLSSPSTCLKLITTLGSVQNEQLPH